MFRISKRFRVQKNGNLLEKNSSYRKATYVSTTVVFRTYLYIVRILVAHLVLEIYHSKYLQNFLFFLSALTFYYVRDTLWFLCAALCTTITRLPCFNRTE